VDERGVGEWIPGLRRGGPPQLAEFVQGSDNVLVVPTTE
jgi:hypothetical protein